jgi:hypothetical protein
MEEQRYAVLIASSQYPQDPSRLHSLRCPERDVDGLNEILASEEYGYFSNISVLKNVPHYSCTRKIHEVLKSARRDDLVLIYYSGHGKLDLQGSLYLATFDTEIEALEVTSIPVESIRKYIYLSASRKVILILDCCYSGRVGEAFLKSGVDDQLQQAQQIQGGRGIYILTASTGLQVAQEKEGDEYSLLTKHVLEGIKDGNADPDGKGFVSIDDVYRYAVAEMRKNDFQEPMKWDLNVQGDELVIARTGKDSEERKRQRAKRILYDLSSKELLPHKILNEALAVLDSPPDVQLPPQAELHGLLDQLVKKAMTDGDFVFQWQAITRRVEEERQKEEIKTLYSEAKTATDQKNWSVAISNLKQVLALDSKHAEAQTLLKRAEQELELSLKQAEQQPQSIAGSFVVPAPSDSQHTVETFGESYAFSQARHRRSLLILGTTALIIVVIAFGGFLLWKIKNNSARSGSSLAADNAGNKPIRYAVDALQTIATELDPFSVALSRNGRFLGIIGQRDEWEAQLWQTEGKQRLPFPGKWGSLATSPIEEDLFAIGSFDGKIEVRRFSAKDPVQTLRTESGFVFSLRFSPDGHVLVATIRDPVSQTKRIQTWRTQNWDNIGKVDSIGNVKLNKQEKISAVSLAINQVAVITPTDGVELRSLFDGKLVKRLPGSERISGDGIFSVDAKMLVLGVDKEPRVLVWKSFDEGPVLYDLDKGQTVTSLTVDPEGFLVAAGLSDGTFKVWRVDNDTVTQVVQAHTGAVRGISFSGDGRTIASVGADKLVKTWRVSKSN